MTHFRQDDDVGVSQYGLSYTDLPYSSLQKLLLLPSNYSMNIRDSNVHRLLQASGVLHTLYDLEKSIQPVTRWTNSIDAAMIPIPSSIASWRSPFCH